jgi:hypothetical protein
VRILCDDLLRGQAVLPLTFVLRKAFASTCAQKRKKTGRMNKEVYIFYSRCFFLYARHPEAFGGGVRNSIEDQTAPIDGVCDGDNDGLDLLQF